MKHLRTFESFSINEEEGIKKFFTGHDSKEEMEEAKANFEKALDDAEEQVSKDPENYVFNRESLEKKAKENKYLGGLRIQKGGRSPKIYVVYDRGATGFENVAGSARTAMRQ